MVQRRGRVSVQKQGTQQQSGLPNFVRIVDRYKRAVVGIEVVQEQPVSGGRLFPFGFDRNSTSPRNVNIGTGFVFDKSGLILTNEHVIHGASRVYLRYYGRKSPVPATVVGTDYKHDIAILKSSVPFKGDRTQNRIIQGSKSRSVGGRYRIACSTNLTSP